MSCKIRYIKICGLTSIEDAKAAVGFGADILGMVMHPQSPRCCKPENAQKIIRSLSLTPNVLVFADNDIHYARDLVNSLDGQMTFIQAPSETALFSWLVENYPREKIIPVYSIQRGAESGSFARPLGDSIDNLKNHPWIILDTGGVVGHSGETLYGGTGRTFDWNLVRNLNRKFFLAGGLNVHNIADAIRITDAQAFDVSSGIEASPGIKDHKMMKRFIQEIRQANDQQGSI